MKHFLLVASFVLVLGPSAVWAQSEESRRDGVTMRTEPDDDARLRQWLALRASQSSRTGDIVSGFGASAALGGLGVYAFVDDDQSDLLGRMNLTLAITTLAMPIALLVTANHPELDYEALPDRPLTEREIGRYEGLLEAEARQARMLRIGAGIQGAFLLAGSSIGLGLTLSNEGFGDSPIEAGIYIGLGVGSLIMMVSAFFKRRPERIWNAYQAGFVPDGETSGLEFRGDSFRLTF